jgi:hypothetical protein
VGKAMPGKVLWCAEWVSPVATATAIKNRAPNEDGACVQCWFALAFTTIPDNSGNLDPVLKFVQVSKAPAAVALQVCIMGNIISCGHEIPEIAISSKTEDGRNERWIVNSHIDMMTQNHVYN